MTRRGWTLFLALGLIWGIPFGRRVAGLITGFAGVAAIVGLDIRATT